MEIFFCVVQDLRLLLSREFWRKNKLAKEEFLVTLQNSLKTIKGMKVRSHSKIINVIITPYILHTALCIENQQSFFV